MGDLRYALSLIITLLSGYFNRDDAFGQLLDKYNDDFTQQSDIDERLQSVFSFIEECGFERKSRAWRKADLFTLIVELDQVINVKRIKVQPRETVETLEGFYDQINTHSIATSTVAGIYYKAALQASNDRINRVRRGCIIGGKMLGKTDEEIMSELRSLVLL